MDLGIDGRVALVCGGSRGLGRATAAALVSEGTAVMCCARDGERLAETARELTQQGGRVEVFAGDIAEETTPDAAVAATLEAFGRIDIVVPNAGGPPPGRSLEVDDAAIRTAVEANLLSAVRLVRTIMARCCR